MVAMRIPSSPSAVLMSSFTKTIPPESGAAGLI